MSSTTKYFPYIFLAVVAAVSITLKLGVFNVGAPYVTIDDHTLFNAGFIVWFGEAPPQRMYLESWVAGAISIATYIVNLLLTGNIDHINLNIVADAYKDFVSNPEPYVASYRASMLLADLTTAALVFFLAKQLFQNISNQIWLAACAASLFLLSYNTLWCYLVARPDTLTSLFAVLGMYFYYKSNFGEQKKYLLLSAISLGCATGMKLHAALFVAFICMDLLREEGLKKSFSKMCLLAFTSSFIFMVVAGSPLFDPLLYAKLRMLNIKDDASPWIQWGEQIVTQLEGTGWLISPLVLLGTIYLVVRRETHIPANIKSVLFISCLFILFFLSIRQLRSYWMLPALPLIYISGVYFISRINQQLIRFGIASVLGITLFLQILAQGKQFDNSRYNELQNWVQTNASATDVIYIIGFDTLFLPCNTICLQNRSKSLLTSIHSAQQSQENFTSRHVRLWEERAQLKLIDMLDTHSDAGFNYYNLNTTPLIFLSPNVTYEDIKIVLAMQGYKTQEANNLLEKVKSDFSKVGVANAPGGKAGTGGLPYDIYVRNAQ